MAYSGRRMDVVQRVLIILSCLDLKHDERRRARISRGYKAGELQPHYLIQLKYVRKLDLLHLCFSLNFYFLMFLRNFLLCFLY